MNMPGVWPVFKSYARCNHDAPVKWISSTGLLFRNRRKPGMFVVNRDKLLWGVRHYWRTLRLSFAVVQVVVLPMMFLSNVMKVYLADELLNGKLVFVFFFYSNEGLPMIQNNRNMNEIFNIPLWIYVNCYNLPITYKMWLFSICNVHYFCSFYQ